MNKEQWRIAEVAGLRAEVERLHEERVRWRADNEKISQDNDRLREALQIAADDLYKIGYPEAALKARAALEQKP